MNKTLADKLREADQRLDIIVHDVVKIRALLDDMMLERDELAAEKTRLRKELDRCRMIDKALGEEGA